MRRPAQTVRRNHQHRSKGLQFPSVACPRCGGTSRVPLAPGYWRCASEVVDIASGSENGRRGRITSLEARPECGCTYQDSAESQSSPSCYCGTFAVGTCTDCGMMVCGDHSALLGDRRLCTEHWRAHTHRIATERLANERLGRDTAHRAWQERVQALGGATAEERLVRAVASYTPDLHRLSTHRSEDETSWAAVCLALDTGSIPTWESTHMYDWFRSRAARPPSNVASRPSAGESSGRGCVNRDAWVFASSTVRRLKESGWAHDSIGLLSDGTLLLLRGDTVGPWVDMPQPASPLGPHGLKQMAALLDLPLLEPVSRSAHPLPVPRRG